MGAPAASRAAAAAASGFARLICKFGVWTRKLASMSGWSAAARPSSATGFRPACATRARRGERVPPRRRGRFRGHRRHPPARRHGQVVLRRCGRRHRHGRARLPQSPPPMAASNAEASGEVKPGLASRRRHTRLSALAANRESRTAIIDQHAAPADAQHRAVGTQMGAHRACAGVNDMPFPRREGGMAGDPDHSNNHRCSRQLERIGQYRGSFDRCRRGGG